jgi:deoxyribodipyrimidine photo-lyase
MAVQLVWFKKDLRVFDHKPLSLAAASGEVLCLYVIEPEVIFAEDFDPSHQLFINQCLLDLHKNLTTIGGALLVMRGDLPAVFADLKSKITFEKIWCHEETGNDITYKRDLRVQAWCKANGVVYEEIPQTGVIRRLRNRDGWSKKWFERMGEDLTPTPPRIYAPALPVASDLQPGEIPSLARIGLPPSTRPGAQIGGEALAQAELQSFLYARGKNYRFEMSSPVTGEKSCSRISPYLTFGAISLRTVYQASVERRKHLLAEPGANSWQKSLASFEERLIWHCHFMQKLEDEPEIEFHNMARVYDGLREGEFRQDYFQAWCEGMTGYPMIDACMRALKETGWVNFRMRAMLVSFASFDLWLHWRPTALFLARLFLDYEPGIHYSQFQMQAGTTGINSIRVYSPIKQGLDQDPHGDFIRRYVPELRNVPIEYLHQPELMPPLFQQFHGCIIGQDYPAPIVDHAQASKIAKDKIFALRKTVEANLAADKVFQKHGSRKKPGGKQWR